MNLILHSSKVYETQRKHKSKTFTRKTNEVKPDKKNQKKTVETSGKTYVEKLKENSLPSEKRSTRMYLL